MRIYNNQLQVTLCSDAHDTSNLYGMLSIEANDRAMRELSSTAYKIWTAICLNQHEYTFALSPTYLTQKCGVSESSYRRAIKEFKKKGYMKKQAKNYYYFYELPEAEQAV